MEFYKLKERGGGTAAVKEIMTSSSAWGSKEDLAVDDNDERRGRGSDEGSASRSGCGRAATISWSEDEIPLKGITSRVAGKNAVRVDTREDGDGGGALSPV